MSGDEDQQPTAEPGTELRTIRVGQWRHKTVDGGYRISRFGDEVELPADEIERGDRQGVFTPTVPTATRSAEVDRTLADIASLIADPAGADDSDAATLHHDITNRDQQIGLDAMADFLAKDPADPAPTADDTLTPATGDPDGTAAAAQAPQDGDNAASEPPKRPAKAASVAVWRAYIAAVRPELADEVAGMDKDELQAQAPKGD